MNAITPVSASSSDLERNRFFMVEQQIRTWEVLDPVILDLLMRASSLVTDNAEVRREFQERFRFILVDEFQDTDPLQAELLVLLAAAETAAAPVNPAAVLDSPIRPGALFIVGDPKQSIYRFRRADVGVYREICDRLVARGALRVRLRTSFRSVPAIQRAVNAAFSVHMTGDRASLQADYVELQPARPDHAAQPAVVPGGALPGEPSTAWSFDNTRSLGAARYAVMAVASAALAACATWASDEHGNASSEGMAT